MKKIPILLFVFLGFFLGSNAQIVFSQNFETSKTVMPAGWHQQLPKNDSTNKGWQFDTAYLPIGGYMGSYLAIDGSYFCFRKRY